MRTVSLALWQNCRNVDADTWCKRAQDIACELETIAAIHSDRVLLNF